MKYYVIAGEASGDLHGSNLIKALKSINPQHQFRVWGGDLMEKAGGDLVKHYKDLAFMGFVEVLKNLPTILRNIRFCKQDIVAYQPDVLVLIDYPGFNLRIAKWAKKQGIKVVYYISPQIWAWHSSRVHGIKASVDQMLVILPFERDFYAQYGYPADFVGHPLLDAIADLPLDEAFRQREGLSDKPIIALLPGSRRQEIERMLDVMLAVVPHFPDFQFVVAGAPAIPSDFYRDFIQSYPQVKLVQGLTYSLLQQAQIAAVTSGTATLETALFEVPQVVCYRGSAFSFWIAKRLVNVRYISLVNLIMDRPIVQELIQHDLNAESLTKALNALLVQENAQRIQADYKELKQRLGDSGASIRAAVLLNG
ncbi:MAG TPA: lipid-A-disaccharide synthase [Saprospiraceae bacterium]|nr:lipid-A-disaccharide synthase [Saprospiraceae bacterium]HMQ82109.1 lipid-A-disaccharide synthase [Saprospiraceae bacterium]